MVEYEHFSPEFSQARQHAPNGITLLCPNCHAKKTRNMLSERRVREANQSPAAKRIRYAFSDLEGSEGKPFVKLAGMTLKNCNIPLEVRGFPVLKIESPEEIGGPYRLSATFFNRQGQPSLFIRENEWQVFADSWDVEVVGPSVTVRTRPGEVSLRLVFVPGEGLRVERLDMYCGGFHLVGSDDKLAVYSPNGGCMNFTQCLSDNCNVGLSLT